MSTLTVRRPVSVKIYGLGIEYTSGSLGNGGRAFDLIYTKGNEIRNLTAIDVDRRKGAGPDPFHMFMCQDNILSELHFDGIRYGAFIAKGCRDTVITNVFSQFCWHPIDANEGASRVHVYNLFGYRNGATLNTHPAFETHFTNVECIEGESYNLRSVGGSVRNFRLNTTRDLFGVLFQTVALVDNVYDEYDFIVDDFHVFAPNNTSTVPVVEANAFQRHADFRNIRVARIGIPLHGTGTLHVSGAEIHDIVFRGKTLKMDNIRFRYAYPGLNVANRATSPIQTANATSTFFSNIEVDGAYNHVMRDYTGNESAQFSNFKFKDIAVDFLDGMGATASFSILLSNGVVENCTFPMATHNNQTILTDNVRTIGGSGNFRSKNRGSQTGTTAGDGTLNIPHGLFVAPSWADVQCLGDVTFRATVQSLDATNVVVRIADGATGADVGGQSVTVMWEAEV